MTDTTEKIEAYIKNIPSLSTTVAKVLEICNNPYTSPADLNQVISLDPVLVGRVLKLINSAYYGFGKITHMVRAITMLGINTVKNLALSSAVLGNLAADKTREGLNMEGFWRHSLCVAVTAKILAQKQRVDPKLREEYFTSGLLHDIGKITLNTVLPAEYLIAISESDREKCSLIHAEDRLLGINHCEAGAMIVKAWKLEGAVGDTILYHHNCSEYEGNYSKVLYNVLIANHFAAMMDIGFSGDRYPEKPERRAWELTGLNETVLDEIENDVNNEIEKAQIFLNL